MEHIKYTHEELVEAWNKWTHLPAVVEANIGFGTLKTKEIHEARTRAWNHYVDIRDGLPQGTTQSRWKRFEITDQDI